MGGVMINGLLQGLKTTLANLWYLWVFIGAVVIIRISFSLYKIYRLNKAGLPQIDKMSGEEFEMFLEQLFKRLGYKVERVGHVADYGADLIIEKDGIRTAVQAKRWNNPIPIRAVQEVVTTMAHYNATHSMIVTNNFFTLNARNLAKENYVELVDRQKLASLILKKQ
jgi:restriction system protein